MSASPKILPGPMNPRSLDYEDVTHAETLSRYLETQGVGNNARYTIVHSDPVLQSIYGIRHPKYDVDFKVIGRDQRLERGLYLAFIGVVYLAIGLFVLFRQRRAALTITSCLVLLSLVGYSIARLIFTNRRLVVCSRVSLALSTSIPALLRNFPSVGD